MMRTTGIYNNAMGLYYRNLGVCAMKSDIGPVYFLTVREAEIIAESHGNEEEWELFDDCVALYLGEIKQKTMEIINKYTRSKS